MDYQVKKSIFPIGNSPFRSYHQCIPSTFPQLQQQQLQQLMIVNSNNMICKYSTPTSIIGEDKVELLGNGLQSLVEGVISHASMQPPPPPPVNGNNNLVAHNLSVQQQPQQVYKSKTIKPKKKKQ